MPAVGMEDIWADLQTSHMECFKGTESGNDCTRNKIAVFISDLNVRSGQGPQY